MLLPLLLAACPTPPALDPADEPYQGEGWALRVPEGARVNVEPQVVRIDTPTAHHWIDLERLATETEPETLLRAWGVQNCRPVLWDQSARPTEGMLVMGGTCRIGRRTYWITASVELDDHGVLRMVQGARKDRVPFEEARVVHARTALTLNAGDTPLEPPDHDEMRERVRQTVREGGVGRTPIPGGGALSTNVTLAQRELWTRRSEVGLPARFTAAEQTSEP